MYSFFVEYLVKLEITLPPMYRSDISSRLHKILDIMKDETTVKLREALIQTHVEKIQLEEKIEQLKCHILRITNTPGESCSPSFNVNSLELLRELTHPSAANFDLRKETELVTSYWGIAREMCGFVVSTYARIIFTIFLLPKKICVYLITKYRENRNSEF